MGCTASRLRVEALLEQFGEGELHGFAVGVGGKGGGGGGCADGVAEDLACWAVEAWLGDAEDGAELEGG